MPSSIHKNDDKNTSQISPYGGIEPYKDGASYKMFDTDLGSSNKEIDYKLSMITDNKPFKP